MNSYHNSPALDINEIFFYWKDQLILENISFQVSSQSIVSILGPSGCGKSTLLHILAGLLQPDKGKVQIHQTDVTGKTGLMSYMQQNDLLFPWKTILENVALPLILQGIQKKKALETAAQYFSMFGLQGYEKHLPKELSGGMKQRAALLRTYMMSKHIILLDEPFGALDSLTRRTMQKWLLDMYETLDSTIVLVTHDIEEAIYLSDKIFIMSSLPGKITQTISISTPREEKKKENFLNQELFTLKKEILNLFIQDP
jgi:ABC-type nitrate/sulfonate/bicarbonate transport system ATPase subunit